MITFLKISERNVIVFCVVSNALKVGELIYKKDQNSWDFYPVRGETFNRDDLATILDKMIELDNLE